MQLTPRSKVVVTGGAGFLGRHIVEALGLRGVGAVVPRSKEFDLCSQADVTRLFEAVRPEVVIHAAWNGGGIGYMRGNPALVARDNILMATHLIEACKTFGVEKFVGIGSVCSYPKHAPTPFREESLWDGYPEETNAHYGLAKRTMLNLTQAYAKQFGLNGVHLIMVNLFGPWDNFDLDTSHVIPAMIRKFVAARDAKADSTYLWGDGTPTREFLYVTDAAEAVVRAAERYDSPQPMNIGTGKETPIATLAKKIAQRVGYTGRVMWDATQPNGQPRRLLDVSCMLGSLGFQAKVSLDDGLGLTIGWYESEGRSLWET